MEEVMRASNSILDPPPVYEVKSEPIDECPDTNDVKREPFEDDFLAWNDVKLEPEDYGYPEAEPDTISAQAYPDEPQIDYQEALREAENQIALLSEKFEASKRVLDAASKRAVEAKKDRTAERNRYLEELKLTKDRFEKLEKSSAEEIRALHGQYMDVLATVSEKTNRAKEAIEDRNEMCDKLNEFADGARRAMEQFEAEKEELVKEVQQGKEQFQLEKEAHVKEMEKVKEEFEKEKVDLLKCHDVFGQNFANKWAEERLEREGMRIALELANERLDWAEKEKELMRNERDFFQRMVAQSVAERCYRMNVTDERNSDRRSIPLSSLKSETVVDDTSRSPSPPSVILSHILPLSGVDPFALINSHNEFPLRAICSVDNLESLRVALEKCNKKRLTDMTRKIFDGNEFVTCKFCDVRLNTTINFIYHICSKKHIAEVGAEICADAFDFWWTAVMEAGCEETVAAKIPPQKDLLAELRNENEKMAKELEKYKGRLRAYETKENEEIEELQKKVEKYKKRSKKSRKLKEELEEAERRIETMEKMEVLLMTEPHETRTRLGKEIRRFRDGMGEEDVRRKRSRIETITLDEGEEYEDGSEDGEVRNKGA